MESEQNCVLSFLLSAVSARAVLFLFNVFETNTFRQSLTSEFSHSLDPDFVIVRKNGKGFIVDLLEPHDDSRLDTWAKVKGLAKFADEHEVAFGRLMVARKIGDKLQVVDVADHQTREEARKMGAPADLEALFETL